MPTPVELSAADLAILKSLHADARSPVTKIAKRLRLPESTVRHRLNRLVKTGVVEFAAVTNPLQFGYQIWAWMQVQVEGPRIRDVANELAQVREVYFVGIMAGNFDILVGAVFRSNKELLDFLTYRVPRIRGIVRTSTSSILEVVKRTMATGIGDDVIANGARRPHRRRRVRP